MARYPKGRKKSSSFLPALKGGIFLGRLMNFFCCKFHMSTYLFDNSFFINRHYTSVIVLLAVVVGLNGSVVFAAGNESKCRQWALEDGVPAVQIASYIQECIADQAAPPEPYPVTVRNENSQEKNSESMEAAHSWKGAEK
ncbi:hypothetical protein CCP3SC5AM1_40010 [Gammaproteobacteria bacterium]